MKIRKRRNKVTKQIINAEDFKRKMKEILDEIDSVFDENDEGGNENGKSEIDGNSENLSWIGTMA